VVSVKDRERLRLLAQKQLLLANSPKNQERVLEWKRHNAGIMGRPIVHVELDTFEHEVIDPMLQCTCEFSRRIERDILRAFVNFELFDDDWVVPPFFGVEWQTYFHLFGHNIGRTTATDSSGRTVGHHFNNVIGDLEDDFEKLGETIFGVDRVATLNYKKIAEDIFGDILPVKMTMSSPEVVPTQKIVHLMGMENMFYNMSDYPELFTKMMDQIAKDYIKYLEFLEQNHYLSSTTGFELLKQGSKCFTAELPNNETPKLWEVWGFMDSQESVGLSPEMYHDLIFPCYKKISEKFGLLSYGCCEPISPVWSDVKTLPNLRKVSISPWCNQNYMGEQLRGSKMIFHRKPSPNYLGVGTVLDEQAVTKHIQETLDCAKGCVVEFTQRDVYTIGGDIDKVKRYIQMIRQLSGVN